MDYCAPQTTRRHNPVDSICRKLQTIQWRGDREPNSPFQIPKLSSSSYDSAQWDLGLDLETILKKRAVRGDDFNGEERRRRGMLTPVASKRNSVGAAAAILPPPSATSTPPSNHCMEANVMYTVTSTLGERRGASSASAAEGAQGKMWQWYSSTPVGQTRDSFCSMVPRGARDFMQPEGDGRPRTTLLSSAHPETHSILSYNLNFCSVDSGNPLACELPYPAFVVKRLSMGEGGRASELRKETMAEVSLICEEDLLDTIFHACDTQRQGKVYVSSIVNYLRHTTSRGSEDSGLEELCNMLDPEHKDVSIDLDTYHAIMKEWIDDCRNNGEEPASDLTHDSVKLRDSLSAKRSMLLNVTSGSLEAIGGEASRVDLETSELVYCVTDLRMSNQRLQEEVRGLKQVVEAMEDSNQKLAEENEELCNQARVSQQLAQKERLLKEEVEEMKVTLSCIEEDRARAASYSKHMERENQSLTAQIATLQEENFKAAMEVDELQRRIVELCNINAELQVESHSFDAIISKKDGLILEKSRQMEELKLAVEEYSSVTERLRADKAKLESQMHMMDPNMAGASLSLSGAYQLNQSSSGSLQTELALAQQSPLEAVNHLPSTMTQVSSLDETLDREVLLLLQGPSPEDMALEFKSLLEKLKRDFREEAVSLMSKVMDLIDNHEMPEARAGARLETVQAELDARRADWALGLDQLAQYTDSLEKELIKMASNMRRSRTDILHLSVRVQEQENQKRQLCEELEQLKNPQDSREASCQTPDPDQESGEGLDWDEEFALQDFLKSELTERNHRAAQDGQTNAGPAATTNAGERDGGEEGEQWTVLSPGGKGETRKTSTPLPTHSEVRQPGWSDVEDCRDSAAKPDSKPEVNRQPLQEEREVQLNAHSQAVSVEHQETDDPPDPSHSQHNDAQSHAATESFYIGSAQDPGSSYGQNQIITPENTPPRLAEMVQTTNTSTGPDETIIQCGRAQPTTEDPREGAGVKAEGTDPTVVDMSCPKRLSQDQSADRAVAEDSTCLLPVLVEEEEGVHDLAEASTVAVNMAASPGRDSHASDGKTPTEVGSSPQSATGPSVPHTSQSWCGGEGTPTGLGQLVDNGLQEPPEAIKDSLASQGKNKRELELSRNMEAIDVPKLQDDLSETSVASEKEVETSVFSDTNDSLKEDSNSLSPTDKEIETEFQRLALGFKCDMFTLERRLRLEERSRDLAEENVRKEISSCQGLLQALMPLCEDDNQSMEIIQRLQKNLEILIQSMTRVSSRSEMLGAIHQESRIGKAVEVMIQHVENLRRMYTKEHAELLELRETLMQNERSFGSHTEKEDFRGKKQSSSQYYKSARRVSIAAIPRSGGANMPFDMPRTKDTPEAETERLTRRSPWSMAGKSTARPPLKRFVSSGAWVDPEELSLVMKGMAPVDTDSHSEEEQKEEPVVERRKSSLSELSNKLTSLIMPLKTRQDELFVMLPSPTPSTTTAEPLMAPSLSQSLTSSSRAAAAAVARGRGLWLWLAMVVLLAGLLALLAGLMMQPAVDAAPVGTGDSWLIIQQLLWPYTGLRHNAQPPV
ncbi:inositol 1,4,5-triphosphate receptor associated 2 [Lampris incognitus]|uniref:inositol 1,4,5-triphosphate receptor associated 2 n=1 Tax=Lampris incognitus TaxID=2546036 RepID=UPI0024B5F438|nr:inositol 1,4,5-triphosphate receptor associated 2 [Lampris incognitus]